MGWFSGFSLALTASDVPLGRDEDMDVVIYMIGYEFWGVQIIPRKPCEHLLADDSVAGII